MNNSITPVPDAITHGGTARGFKVCQCFICGAAHQCTPQRDFYILAGFPESGPLACDHCTTGIACGKIEMPAPETSTPARRSASRPEFAQLQIAQGKPANTDFTDSIKFVKIVPCIEAPTETPA